MSWSVSQAYWHFWRAGKRVEQEESAQYKRYVKRAERRGSDYRLLLLALAMDANPLESITGKSELAECYTSIANLAERVQRSRRTIQRLITELSDWNEIQVRACNGKCMVRHHQGTNHYYLPLPPGAEPWGRRNRKEAREHSRRRSA